MTRIRNRGRPRRPPLDAGTAIPKRPYRDSAVFYAILAVLLVVVAWLTAGNVLRAVAFGVGFFAIATAWSWWRFHQKLAQQRAEQRRAERRAAGRRTP